MKIVVINGSPRGKSSSTLYCVKHIQKHFPEHEFSVIDAGRSIIRMDRNDAYLNACFEEVRTSDVVLWSFPVYVFAAPSQLVRFVELIFEKEQQPAFQGKYTTAITTSANFYDHTAHHYIRNICEDLEMPYFEGFSANMFELRDEQLRQNLKQFAEDFFRHSTDKIDLLQTTQPLSKIQLDYQPSTIESLAKKGEKKLALVTDCMEKDQNLQRMIEAFSQAASFPVTVFNLNDTDIRGGCTGCTNCMGTGHCRYNDDFETFYKETLLQYQGIIYAFSIGKRYYSATVKKYFDRCFVNGHRHVLEWLLEGYIISGPLRELPYLREIINAGAQLGGRSSAGIVTDELSNSDQLTTKIKQLADNVQRLFDNPWKRPPTFLGVGGHKVFRDLVYTWRDLMTEDHKYYQEQGLYDFPNIEKSET